MPLCAMCDMCALCALCALCVLYKKHGARSIDSGMDG